MRERLYVVCEEAFGWSVKRGRRDLGLYLTKDDALAAAAEAARKSRAAGFYTWVKVRPREAAVVE